MHRLLFFDPVHTRHHRGSRPRGTSCVFFLPTPARVLGCLALNFHPHPFPTPPFGPACAPALPFSRTVSFIWLAGVSSRLCVCGRGWDKGATRTHVSSQPLRLRMCNFLSSNIWSIPRLFSKVIPVRRRLDLEPARALPRLWVCGRAVGERRHIHPCQFPTAATLNL